jgi:hypothetical protein
LSFFTIASAKTDTSIQNNSGLSQGLWSAIGGTVDHKHGKHLDASWEPKGSRSMNMSVTEFVVPPAIVGRNRSVWREIIDTVMEGPPRTAADEITEYLARHQYDLSPTLRIELERRHVCL